MDFKIGQIITITEEFEIESALGGKKVTVKKGDKGFIDRRGCIHYLTGEANGKIQLVKDAKVVGYDTENIAKLIFKRIAKNFNIDTFLEDNDIPAKEFVEEIEDILTDIL